MDSPDNQKPKNDDDVVERALKRFQLAETAESEIRREAVEDQRFLAGYQWQDVIKNSREQDKRPCLTINQLPQFLRQVTNDLRQNRQSVKVNPVDDHADIETAKVFEGVIRHIEYSSNAEIAYDTAIENQCSYGFGYYRFVTEYSNPESFDQEIRIKQIKDSMAVYLDSNATEPDGSDACWGLIISDMAKDAYDEQYGESQLSDMLDWETLGASRSNWMSTETVRVAEYYEKTFKDIDLVKLSDGTIADKASLPADLPMGLTIAEQRKSKKPIVTWYKLNGVEILESTRIPGSYIPIFPVYGNELIIEGKKILEGVIRHARDPQRMYNYMASAEAEAIALAPKAPFIVAEGQLEGYEQLWKTANTQNHAFLPYKPKTFGGEMAPPPQRNSIEPAVQAITAARGQSQNDLRSTTGIYDTTLGNRSNEASGLAIQRRNSQSQISNFHFGDNAARTMKHAGRVLIEWIPEIYDTARAIRVVGEDGVHDVVKINQIFQKPSGEEAAHYLDIGEYDATVSTGPSYQTKRQEAVASMLSLAQSLPETMKVGIDILVKNMDWPGAQELGDRLKKTIPPQLLDEKDQTPIPPQAQAQIQALQAALQQVSGQFKAADEIVKNKVLEISSKERIEMAKIKADIEINLAKLGAQSAEIMLDHDVAQIDRRLDLLNENQPILSGPGGTPPAASPNINQSTGGLSPGQPMGAQHP